ncbi:uncharacterized protein, partial [Diabrotica undecimpunctata]|uniref:uncharacterized protein n=1 Tax=Diabrotica undecimpunctata TaxID=50387 RepID=UPI003B63ED5E
GCRTEYIVGLNEESKTLLKRYEQLYEDDPFSEAIIQAEEEVLQALSAHRTDRWCKLITSLDMKQNSRCAWKLVRNFGNNPATPAPNLTKVTSDQIAHRLLTNGKTTSRKNKVRVQRNINKEEDILGTSFCLEEMRGAIHQIMTDNKAADSDDIRTKQIKHFEPKTLELLVKMMNCCVRTFQISKIWRKARVVALLKPGKDPADTKSFRPVSLLFHLFKALERMILNRIAESVDTKIIP